MRSGFVVLGDAVSRLFVISTSLRLPSMYSLKPSAFEEPS